MQAVPPQAAQPALTTNPLRTAGGSEESRRIANDAIGPWASISNGTLYPLLTKLEQNGLITRVSDEQSAAQTEQQARTFMITDEGRKRFYQVMMDTSSNIGDYQSTKFTTLSPNTAD